MRGTVKFYNGKTRYGFIVPADGSENIYFAEESLPRGRRYDPVEGDVVEFEIRAAVKGRMAVRIDINPTEHAVAARANGHDRPEAGE